MSKVCRFCGAMNLDNSITCSRCGKSLIVDKVTLPENNTQIKANSTNNNINKNSNSLHRQPKIKTKSKFILVMMCVIFILGVIIKIAFSSTSENDIEKMVPQEVLQYSMQIDDNNEHECKIDSFEIEKRDTSDEYDTAYCKIEMSDQYISRITYLRMDMKKYEKGGWMLESYSEYENEQFMIKKKDIVGKSAAENYAKDLILTNPKCKFNSDTEMEVSYTPFIEHNFLKFEGQVICKFNLKKEVDEFPHSYRWSIDELIDIDYSDVSYSWNIEGKWKAIVGNYDVKLILSRNSDTSYNIQGYADDCYEDNFDVEIVFDDDTHIIPLKKEEYESKKVGFYISYPGFNLFITPTQLKIAEAEFMFTSTVDDAVELIQY